MPNRSDLCFATTNRQAALKAIASESDAVVVIGSANSSNTVALEKVARAGGCPRVLRVNAADDPDQTFEKLIPRLYPFLRHTITSVRMAVLKALLTFLNLSSMQTTFCPTWKSFMLPSSRLFLLGHCNI